MAVNIRDLLLIESEGLEDEQYTITESCLIFVPAGMKHLPLIFRRIDYPVFFWTASDSKSYGRTSGNEF